MGHRIHSPWRPDAARVEARQFPLGLTASS
jgi:hypothetical protein